MIFLPVCLNITDKKVLIIGGGKIALQKVKSLKRYTDSLTILAKEILPELKNQIRDTITKEYESNDIFGYGVVFSCTDNPELNNLVKRDCNQLNIPVNVCDMPELCDFIMPAIVKRGNMSIAVSSNGENVRKSVRIRNRIEEIINDGSIEI